MFERLTDQCKRAIFFAQQAALHGGATEIDSNYLLEGLLSENGTRADTTFHLRDRLPTDLSKKPPLTDKQTMKGTIPLSNDSKRILAYTLREANELRDYWIDTEHLVLGILSDQSNAANAKLRTAGLDLESCRKLVVCNKGSRPPRPDPVLWWVRERADFTTVAVFIFELGIAAALFMLDYVGIGLAVTSIVIVHLVFTFARKGSVT